MAKLRRKILPKFTIQTLRFNIQILHWRVNFEGNFLPTFVTRILWKSPQEPLQQTSSNMWSIESLRRRSDLLLLKSERRKNKAKRSRMKNRASHCTTTKSSKLFSRWHKHTQTYTHTHKHTQMEVVHETLLSLSMALKETENKKKKKTIKSK